MGSPPPDVVQQFESDLDAYMDEWEAALRQHVGGQQEGDLPECGGEGGKPGPCPEPGSDESHAQADRIATDPGLWAKIKQLPAKVVSKAAGLAKGLYNKTEEKYGPRWAKAIVGTAIITLPTPFATVSVLAMTGLAHVWTKYVSGGPARTALAGEAEIELSAQEIKELADQFLAELAAGTKDLHESRQRKPKRIRRRQIIRDERGLLLEEKITIENEK